MKKESLTYKLRKFINAYKLISLRYLGNFLMILGYFLILNTDIKIGLILRIFSHVILFPIFIKLKMWDVFLTTIFFLFIDTFKLSGIVFDSI
jgi:hypothetical protein